MPHRPHQLNLAGALTHKGETYLPDFIRTGPPRWNRLYTLTEDGGENKIKIKMAGRELYYAPTKYWDFEKTSLKNWLSDTLIESKELAFKMLRVKTGFNLGDADLPTLVDAPLELLNDDASDNPEDQEDQTLDDEVTSFVPKRKRPKRPLKKHKIKATPYPPSTGYFPNQKGGRYFNRQAANGVGFYIDTRGRRPSRAGQPEQRFYRGQYRGPRGYGAQRPYQGRRPYRGRYRGGSQPEHYTPVQPPAPPPANPPTVPQTTQAPFVPWPVPMMGCGHNQFSNASPLLNPLLNMLLPR
jgi:hypothetical protein